MTIDDQIRDALRERAGDVASEPGALNAIETGVVRARRRRAALAVVGALIVVAGGGLTASRLLSSDDASGFVAPGTPSETTFSDTATAEYTPTPSTAVDPEPEVLTWEHTAEYVDRRGYYVAYPEDFDRSEWEGNVEIRINDTPSLASGMPTWAVNFDVARGTARLEPCTGTAGKVVIRGESVDTCQTLRDGEYVRTYAFYWADQPCDHPELGCRSQDEGITVTARIIGGNRELWDQHLEHGEKIIGTVRRTSTSDGTNDARDFRAVLDKFLAARVNGRDAERYMAKSAEPYPEMYGHGSGPTDYVSSVVKRQDAADANSYVFTVDITSQDGTISHEEIGVGAEDGAIAIRFIQLTSREIS